MELFRIFNALTDDTSKSIFKHRLLFSLLDDYSEISNLVVNFSPAAELFKRHKGKVCFYGAGTGANWIVKYNRQVPFVIDKFKVGEIEGIPIISLADFLEMSDYKDYLVIVTIGKAEILEAVKRELDSYGITNLNAYSDLQYQILQYFDLPAFSKVWDKEFFVDAGALDGETTKEFFRHYPGGHAYVFEPSLSQYEITKNNLKDLPEAEVFPYGVFDESKTVSFELCETDASSAKVSESGTETVEVRRLDDVLENRPVTFIKMDIEGAELAALKGAEHIIRSQHPKLAICVYHKPQDIWEIPELILSYCPDYKLYLRHYSISYTETVLYAVVPGC